MSGSQPCEYNKVLIEPTKTRKAVMSIRDDLELLLAIETIEYHNKNFLAFNGPHLSENKRALIIGILNKFPRSAKWTC